MPWPAIARWCEEAEPLSPPPSGRLSRKCLLDADLVSEAGAAGPQGQHASGQRRAEHERRSAATPIAAPAGMPSRVRVPRRAELGRRAGQPSIIPAASRQQRAAAPAGLSGPATRCTARSATRGRHQPCGSHCAAADPDRSSPQQLDVAATVARTLRGPAPGRPAPVVRRPSRVRRPRLSAPPARGPASSQRTGPVGPQHHAAAPKPAIWVPAPGMVADRTCPGRSGPRPHVGEHPGDRGGEHRGIVPAAGARAALPGSATPAQAITIRPVAARLSRPPDDQAGRSRRPAR